MSMAGGVSLRIELLGGFRIAVKGEPVTGALSGRLQSLIAYLVLHPDAAISRQQLAFLFWADSEESQARTNLRQLLHHLRAVLPDTGRLLKSDHQALWWQPGDSCSVDAMEFQEAAASGDPETAARLYQGDLLPGLYDEWIEPERERLKQIYETVLDRLVARAEQDRDFSAAIQFAEMRLARDTLREASYQTLMRLHALAGDRSGALRVYDRCARVLREELDVEPGPATRRVRDGINDVQPATEPVRLQAAAPRTAPEVPLIGRESEWAQIETAWRRASGGHPWLLLLTGEAGIGKTRLLEELQIRAASDDRTCIARASCYAGGGALPYATAADWLRSPAIRPHVDELPATQRSQLAVLLPDIRSDEGKSSPRTAGPWQKREFFEAMARAVLRPDTPTLLAIDDVQWCDPETLEWLPYLLRFHPSARLLIAATVRTEDATAGMQHLATHGVEIQLGPLSEQATGQLAARIAGRNIDAATSFYAQTRGNPLFVVETVRAGWSAGHRVPPRVRAVITTRLERLSENAREIAAIAAVIQRPFKVEVAAAASGMPEQKVVRAVDELWEHRIVEPEPAGAYDFSHGLIREVSYNTIGPAQRRVLHRRVAESIESLHSSDPDAICGYLAEHYERAGLPDRAVPWYQRAARVSGRRFAETEAIGYLNKALRLLESLPTSAERDRIELDLLLALGLSLSVTEGYASEEAGRVYARARVLCEIVRDPARYFRVLAGSSTFHIVRAELAVSLEMAERYLALAGEHRDPMLLAAGHFSLGCTSCHMGMLGQGRQHLDASLRCEAESERSGHFLDFGPELGVFCVAYLSHALWLTGEPDEALERSRKAVARAESISHPFSLALALAYSAMLHHFREEPEPALERADAAAAVCRRYGFRYYLSWTPIIAGWATARLGDRSGGLTAMLEGYKQLRSTGAGLRAPYYLGLIAEASGNCGDVEGGLRYIDEAMRLVETSQEEWPEPELHRIRGDLLRGQGQRAEAKRCYETALRLARKLGARAWEQRIGAQGAQIRTASERF